MEQQILNKLLDKLLDKDNDVADFYNQNIKHIEVISPDEVFEAMQGQRNRGRTETELLVIVDKTINILHKQLSAHPKTIPSKGTFIYYLNEENKALKKRLDDFKLLLVNKDLSTVRKHGLALAEDLKNYDAHLLKLENILFPAMEKEESRFLDLSIMWALHDEIRAIQKEAKRIFDQDQCDLKTMSIVIGGLFFKYYGHIQKQELLLFPAAEKWIGPADMEGLHKQSFDIGFAYIDAPKDNRQKRDNNVSRQGVIYDSSTGSLNIEQIDALFRNLPVDLTVIDHNDKVAYFSDNSERIFPRTPAVIGRKVQNCHPPKSLAMVEEILDSFKENKKNEAVFWINLNARMVLIKYYALRSETGKYLGTLEVTQDITDIKTLDGEKRLI